MVFDKDGNYIFTQTDLNIKKFDYVGQKLLNTMQREVEKNMRTKQTQLKAELHARTPSASTAPRLVSPKCAAQQQPVNMYGFVENYLLKVKTQFYDEAQKYFTASDRQLLLSNFKQQIDKYHSQAQAALSQYQEIM